MRAKQANPINEVQIITSKTASRHTCGDLEIDQAQEIQQAVDLHRRMEESVVLGVFEK
jgi:hypothetical protein